MQYIVSIQYQTNSVFKEHIHSKYLNSIVSNHIRIAFINWYFVLHTHRQCLTKCISEITSMLAIRLQPKSYNSLDLSYVYRRFC